MLGAAQQRREHVDVVRAEHGVDPRGLFHDAVTHLLSEAAANCDLHPGACSLDGSELAKITEKTGRGVLAHGAGVDNDDVSAHVTGVGCARGGFGDSIDGNEAGLLQQPRHAFGVVFVHLAAERAHRVGARQRGAVLHHRIHRIEV